MNLEEVRELIEGLAHIGWLRLRADVQYDMTKGCIVARLTKVVEASICFEVQEGESADTVRERYRNTRRRLEEIGVGEYGKVIERPSQDGIYYKP